MKIRTLEKFVDALDTEMAWRKKELIEIKRLVDSRKGSHGESTFIRSGVAILYAHWEGFIKAAGTAYLNYVAMQRLKYEELSDNLIALCMKSQLNLAGHTNKATIYSEVAKFFLTRLSDQSTIPWESAIETKANLKSDVLREVVCTLGIDYKHYETKEKLLDEKLLKRRNEIAHGQYSSMDYTAFILLYDEMLNLLQLFRNQLDNAATTRAYKRETSLTET